MYLIHQLTNNATHLSEEELTNLTELTFVKEIYSCWKSNDYGDDVDLYTGISPGCVTPRYFLKHFCRDWDGGWTYDETTTWCEIPQKEYLRLCQNKDNP